MPIKHRRYNLYSNDNWLADFVCSDLHVQEILDDYGLARLEEYIETSANEHGLSDVVAIFDKYFLSEPDANMSESVSAFVYKQHR